MIREVQEEIRRILLDDWDPIGVKDVPEAQDEYDAYVGQIFSLVAKDSGAHPIAQLLCRIETDRMGLSGSTAFACEPLAAKLSALAARLK